MASQFEENNSPVYFWNPGPGPEAFLSQWHPAPFTGPAARLPSYLRSADDYSTPAPETTTFPTAEHFMMYHKALLFNDNASAEAVLKASTPQKAQGIGRKVYGFDGELWGRWKERIVEEGNWAKFTAPVENGDDEGDGESKVDLGKKLLETGDRELVEASPFDRTWGVGFDADHANQNREDWGLNLLGKALMRVRTRMRESENQGATCRG
ncbi:hypothetical protein MMC25_003872 [Agyrium rufum]|nr:hypothetical protein [Agyrium rufum]